MNKNTIIILVVVIIAIGGYFLFMNKDVSAPSIDKDSVITYTGDGEPVVYCDEAGNRYETVAKAKAAGLTEAQYGATYCPEYVTAQTEDYVGMTLAAAEAKAAADGTMFRVVIKDGEPQAITMDLREGRINATVKDGVVTEYSIETSSPILDETSYCSDIKSRTTDSEKLAFLTEVSKGSTLVPGQTIAGCIYPVSKSYEGWAPFEGQVGSYELQSSNGIVLASGPLATINQNWMEAAMNGEAIKYHATIDFDPGLFQVGKLIFKNENASGDPETEITVTIPVKF